MGVPLKVRLKPAWDFSAFSGEGNKQALVERPGALREKKFSKSHLSDFLAEIKLTARLWTADKVLHHARRCECAPYTCCFH